MSKLPEGVPDRDDGPICWWLPCLLGLNRGRMKWLGERQDELWACCKRCARPRIFLAKLDLDT